MDATCSCCGLKFKLGVIINGIEVVDRQSFFRKKWKKKKIPKKYYICEKCRNIAFGLIRNNLALKTRDIIDD